VKGVAKDRLHHLLVLGLVASLSLTLANGMTSFPIGQFAFRVGYECLQRPRSRPSLGNEEGIAQELLARGDGCVLCH
jgi:hypothetical protein